MKTVQLGIVCAGLHVLLQWAIGFGLENNSSLCYPFISYSYKQAIEMPTAVNDTFTLAVGCNSYEIEGNIMTNDNFDPNTAWISQVNYPHEAYFSCSPTGDFIFRVGTDLRGEVSIKYRLSLIEDADSYTEGVLTIYVDDDFDCDKVVNSIDIDDDNDGIIDFHEGDETVDTDGDGIANCYDIDSDNDGITDLMEWQAEGSQLSLSLQDANGDGWDDAFDPQEGGTYYEQTDTDLDGIPDFLDIDSDNDGILDFVEAYDILDNRIPELKFSNIDTDCDGLDNSCDTINCAVSRFNPMGSNSPLPDHNNNGIRDWRDTEHSIIEVEPQNIQSPELNLLVYPNPVINECIVKMLRTEDLCDAPYSLKIYDINGRMVHIELLYQYENTLNLEHLINGMYLLRIKAAGNIYSTKVLKSN